jgi:hypothetical protein
MTREKYLADRRLVPLSGGEDNQNIKEASGDVNVISFLVFSRTDGCGNG